MTSYFEQKIPGMLLMIDIEVFDSVAWSFIHLTFSTLILAIRATLPVESEQP